MIVIMKQGATVAQIAAVETAITELGFRPYKNEGADITIIAVLGNNNSEGKSPPDYMTQFDLMEAVERTERITQKYKLVGLQSHPNKTLVPINGMNVGGSRLAIIAGPCS